MRKWISVFLVFLASLIFVPLGKLLLTLLEPLLVNFHGLSLIIIKQIIVPYFFIAPIIYF